MIHELSIFFWIRPFWTGPWLKTTKKRDIESRESGKYADFQKKRRDPILRKDTAREPVARLTRELYISKS
jgi:hypothetical protein